MAVTQSLARAQVGPSYTTAGIYVFVDEFDAPFTKTLIGAPKDLGVEFRTKVLEPISATYITFFELVKKLSSSRLLMTGIVDIAPKGLASLSFERVTFDSQVHSFAGFTEEEVKGLLSSLRAKAVNEDQAASGWCPGPIEGGLQRVLVCRH